MASALVGMSGGVDSSVAAFLMHSNGYDCTGVMMKLFSNDEIGESEGTCCTVTDAEDARAVADKIGFPFFVFNYKNAFKTNVIDRFVTAYANGITPNPCVDCNRFVRFPLLCKRAKELEIDKVVTGHYAQIEYNRESGRYELKKGEDESKDQSYVLYGLTQTELRLTILPLGKLRKDEVREIALSQGFINARKRDSQDICFVPDGDYAGFIERHGVTGKKGRFRTLSGRDLGEHRGIIHYTVGQRRGLGLSMPNPVYAIKLDHVTGDVFVGEEAELYTKSLTTKNINLIAVQSLDKTVKFDVKVRYAGKFEPAYITQTDEDTLNIEFIRGQRAVTSGQAAVIYDGNQVVGGGTIV